MSIDFAATTAALRGLGASKPNAAARLQLEEALRSKWYGIRVVAAQSLCAWKDEASVLAVRDALWQLSSEPARLDATGAIARALAPQLQQGDLEWAAQLFAHQFHADNMFSIGALFEVFEANRVADLLSQELGSSAGGKSKRYLDGAIWRANYRLRNAA